jgi:hypothetical protein
MNGRQTERKLRRLGTRKGTSVRKMGSEKYQTENGLCVSDGYRWRLGCNKVAKDWGANLGSKKRIAFGLIIR